MRKCDHPHIIKYFETYQEPKDCYMVMELCEGGTIGEKLALEENNREAKAANYMYQCCLALQHCSQLNIIHRDIKPDNIMIGNDGEVKLIDFGLSLIREGQ